MLYVEKVCSGLPECNDILDLVRTQQENLQKDVHKYSTKRGS